MSKWETVAHTKWETEDYESKFKESLVKRAKKRHGTQVSKRRWIVDGDHKLGDEYEAYYVKLAKGAYKYTCTCYGHTGGGARSSKMCSHALYVALARKGQVDYTKDFEDHTGTLNSDATEEQNVGYPLRDVPLYVEGSGASLAERREALREHFCNSREFRELPEWVHEIRMAQQYALEEIETMYAEGKKVVFLDAPTGVGKTLIGEMARRRVAPSRSVYTCSTLTLQDQFLEDFPYADVIKGRANYATEDFAMAWPKINAGQCTANRPTDQCELCSEQSECPYRIAKAVALTSQLAVANIAYLLTMANYQKKFTDETLVIIDEADVLEQQLLGFISITIPKSRMRKYGINPPKKKTVMESWVEWIQEEAVPKIFNAIMDIKSNKGWSNDHKVKKEKDSLEQLLKKLQALGGWDRSTRSWTDDHDLEGWVYMDYEKGDVTFKPISVAEYGQDILWRHSAKWLLMSATIISAEQMADDLGLEEDEWGVVTVDSDFPVESRPIYVQPVANMTWKNKDTEWPKMAKAIRSVAAYHNDERILVHTVSYKLTEYLRDRIGHRAFSYTSPRNREKALKDWLLSPDGIMLAPSFDRGVDLKDDLCRVMVIAKIPYPSLGDKQVNGRLYSRGGQSWYSMLTVRSVVQMTGRAMRSKDDSCETYVFDKQFVSVMKNRKMLPKWWSNALVRSGVPKDRGIR